MAEISAIELLKDPYTLPPKRSLSTTLIPSAWVDDRLISERKRGLSQYLEDLLKSPDYKDRSMLLHFLVASERPTIPKFHVEDVCLSTLPNNAVFKDVNF